MRYIDSFNHFFPSRLFERIATRDMGKHMRGIPALCDPDERLRVVEPFDDYTQVLSLGVPVEFVAGPKQSERSRA